MMNLKKAVFGFIALELFLTGTSHATSIHNGYAVLFSGGGDSSSNYERYYDQTLRMWNITTGLLNFDPANVYVLFADGNDPGLDQCIDTGSGCNYVNSDWSMLPSSRVVSATHDNLRTLFGLLDDRMDDTDTLYFWSFDHGSNPGPDTTDDDVELVAWGSPWIRDDELAAWVDPLDVKAEIFAFAQCFSGGMVDDLHVLDPGSNRFAAWAAQGCEPSRGDGWADAWADGLESGLRSTSALGDYALKHDPFGPFGQGLEHPGYAGRNFDNIPAAEPPILWLLNLGVIFLIFAGWSRSGGRVFDMYGYVFRQRRTMLRFCLTNN